MARHPQSDPQTDAILLVARELCGIREQLVKQQDNNAILCRMEEIENKIMSAVSEYSELVNTKFSEIGDSVDEVVAAVSGVSGDVASLKDIILKLENNPGPISPEDQALLTQGVARVTALSDRLNGVATTLKELDAATATTEVPPVPEQ